MIFNYEKKTVQVKIVYYGPAMSGKTTSIKRLFSYFNKEDTLTSIDSTVGRTLFFDFGVLQFKSSDWSLKFLIYSATGEDFYASTRLATLNGVDAVIFVVDSQDRCLHHNLRSWNELKAIFGNELYNLPMVISLNKSDFDPNQEIKDHGFIKRININQFKNISANKTVAPEGKGILDAFSRLLELIFPNLKITISC